MPSKTCICQISGGKQETAISDRAMFKVKTKYAYFYLFGSYGIHNKFLPCNYDMKSNYIHEEIKNKLNFGDAHYCLVQNNFSSFLLSKNVNIKICCLVGGV
jgi:hypothetical protein